MQGSKPWYTSKTVWSGIVSLIAGLAGTFDYTVTPAQQAALPDLMVSLAAAIGGLGTIIGRIKAVFEIDNKRGGGILPTLVLAVAVSVLFVSSPIKAQNNSGYLEWTPPDQRENGEAMTADEIGGYEIRYTVGDETFRTVVPDGSATGYDVAGLDPAVVPGATTFEIAAYDTNGLYSEFVEIEVQVPGVRPGQPLDLRYIPPAGADPTEACVEDPECRTDMLSARYPPE